MHNSNGITALRNDHSTDKLMTEEEKTAAISRLDPPSEKTQSLKNPSKLILEIIYVVVVFIPLFIWSGIEYFFLTKRKSIRDKVVLVTGSGRGLGQGFALKFAEYGCSVACVDIDDSINRETVDIINKKYPGKARSYIYNLAMPDHIKELKKKVIEDFDKVDIIVNNAAVIGGMQPYSDFSNQYLRNVIDVNLTSHFLMAREFLPDMIKRNEGHIVAIASVAGLVGGPNGSMYVATKHGVIGFMESLHYDLEEIPNNNVKTTTVCPYFINTSAFYNQFYKTRLPTVSINEVIKATINGIQRNERIITVPRLLYYVLAILKLLPDRLCYLLRKVFYAKIILPSKTVQENTPLYKLLQKSAKSVTKL